MPQHIHDVAAIEIFFGFGDRYFLQVLFQEALAKRVSGVSDYAELHFELLAGTPFLGRE